MKISSHYVAAAVAAFALSLGSCSVLQPASKSHTTTVSGAAATEITPAAPAPSQSEPARPASDVKTSPRPAVPDSAAESADTSTTALDLGGEWTVFQVGPTTIDLDEDFPYIIFEPSTRRFYAFNGCNTLNGDYGVEASSIIFSNVLSTLRMCDLPYEADINDIVSERAPATFRLSEAGTESYLDISGGTGRATMRLRRNNLQFINGQWDVTSIAGISSIEAPARVFFDLAEKTFHGNTGCNIVNGEIYTDYRRTNAIDFSNMTSTLMACPFDKQQTAMLVALEETASAISDGNDKLMLLNSDGKVVMTLRKANISSNE